MFSDNVIDILNNRIAISKLNEVVLNDIDFPDFCSKRIFIKDLDSQIVNFTLNSIQNIHLENKKRLKEQTGNDRFLVLKSRRLGITTLEQSQSYFDVVTKRNVTCATIADNADNTSTIYRMVKMMGDYDPDLQYPMDNNQKNMKVEQLGTHFDIGTAGAKAFKRGDNVKRLHGSEVAFWRGKVHDIETIVAGMTEATLRGQVTFETTANGASGYFYEVFHEAMKGNNSWNPIFYAWFVDPNNVIPLTDKQRKELLDTITDDEKEIVAIYKLSMEQLAWRRKKIKDKKRLFQQEYPETWEQAFLIRGFTFFDSNALEYHSKHLDEPVQSGDNLIIWKQPEELKKYCIGADASEGNQNSDFCVGAVLDKESGEQAAVLRGKWRPHVFARKLAEIGKKFNNAVICVESNNHGHSVLNTLQNDLMYKNLYHRLKTLDTDKFGKKVEEKIVGWVTNAKTRPILLDDLNEAIEKKYIKVNDSIFLAECRTFVDNGGKYEADSGENDDSIIAWGIAWQCRKQKSRTLALG